MTVDEPRTIDAGKSAFRERRREAILDAAEDLFIEQGYDQTILAEIVRRSGGSLATLYELFGNKQGLLHAIAIRWVDRTKAQRAERDNAAERSNREILMSYVRSECALSQSPRTTALMRMLVSESLSDRSFAIRMYHEVRRPFIDELSSLFAAWAAAGNALIEDPEATAQLFISIISGDTVLGRLFGVDEEFLDEEEILWRLQPFFGHFEIS